MDDIASSVDLASMALSTGRGVSTAVADAEAAGVSRFGVPSAEAAAPSVAGAPSSL